MNKESLNFSELEKFGPNFSVIAEIVMSAFGKTAMRSKRGETPTYEDLMKEIFLSCTAHEISPPDCKKALIIFINNDEALAMITNFVNKAHRPYVLENMDGEAIKARLTTLLGQLNNTAEFSE
jgi:hypothetical protein